MADEKLTPTQRLRMLSLLIFEPDELEEVLAAPPVPLSAELEARLGEVALAANRQARLARTEKALLDAGLPQGVRRQLEEERALLLKGENPPSSSLFFGEVLPRSGGTPAGDPR